MEMGGAASAVFGGGTRKVPALSLKAAVNHQILDMKTLHALICFFLSLQDGTTAGVNAQVYTRTKGENIVSKCSSSSTGSSKIFCKETCDRGNVLIETTENQAERGRYSLRYEDRSGGSLLVSIKQLQMSDSGLYRCGLGSSSSPASLMEFEIIVIDALLNQHNGASAVNVSATSGEDLTVVCVLASAGQGFVFCKNKCKDEDILARTSSVRDTRGRFSIRYLEQRLYVSIGQLKESDSGLYTCGLDTDFSSASQRQFRLVVTDATPTSKPARTLQPLATTVPENPKPPTPPQSETPPGGILLCVGLTLAVVVVLSSLAVLIVCIKRKTKPRGLTSRRDDTRVEVPVYENPLPVFTCDEPIYQSLDPATRDQNQIYSTLTAKQQHK
ncbi:polymeric immunoglobulin receptor-like [Channa argus]|uniref:polymeric immunoglobulin receptor-like n=1 Tax=Channa argus TaxID=215402 RepID=UPI00351F9472